MAIKKDVKLSKNDLIEMNYNCDLYSEKLVIYDVLKIKKAEKLYR